MIFNSDLIYIGVHQRWGNNLNLSLEVAFILTLKCMVLDHDDESQSATQIEWSSCESKDLLDRQYLTEFVGNRYEYQ